MEFETLPNGEKIPVLGLGTWNIGGGMSPSYGRDAEGVASIQTAIKLGYTHIDTAEMYGGGHTEELVGRAMQPFDRQTIFLTTKVSPSHLHYQAVHNAFNQSLQRLHTDYVDLYLIHWPNTRISLEETFRALNELVAQKGVRHLGVSNFNLDQLRQAQSLAATPIITNQVPLSLRDRTYQRNGMLAYCQEQNVLLTAYSPLKGGVLNHPDVHKIAHRHKATPAQIALHWLIRQPKVITIPKSTNGSHLVENLGALNLKLSSKDLDILERIP